MVLFSLFVVEVLVLLNSRLVGFSQFPVCPLLIICYVLVKFVFFCNCLIRFNLFYYVILGQIRFAGFQKVILGKIRFAGIEIWLAA